MPIETLVTFESTDESTDMYIDGTKLLDVLGEREEAVALQLKELITSGIDAAIETITNPAKYFDKPNFFA